MNKILFQLKEFWLDIKQRETRIISLKDQFKNNKVTIFELNDANANKTITDGEFEYIIE